MLICLPLSISTSCFQCVFLSPSFHPHTASTPPSPQEKNHFILVDMAYQGFATGDLERDAAGLRLLAKDGHKLALCQSFSKNMGLYGERGC